MKNDANIKVPRASYERMRSFALHAGRDIREATGTAMDLYVERCERTCEIVGRDDEQRCKKHGQKFLETICEGRA